jgi:hypothetical protein
MSESQTQNPDFVVEAKAVYDNELKDHLEHGHFGGITALDPSQSDLDFLVEFPVGYDFGPWMSRFVELRRRLAELFIPRAVSDETFDCFTPTPSAWARTPLA